MKKILPGIIIIIIVALAAAALIIFRGPDLTPYMHLTMPAISQKADQTMLVVEMSGNPDTQAGKAIKLLYGTYFSLRGVTKDFSKLIPRARWNADDQASPELWKGYFALPVPDTLTTLPIIEPQANMTVSIQKWEYGTVAEILHAGPYENEQPTIDKLQYYITQNGYKIIGSHEEEYLKGPGMLGKGNPKKYLTIIRYRIALINPGK